MAGALLCGAAGARADQMYLSYSNGDNYVEEYSTTGISGTNTDLGPLPGTTTYTNTPNGIALNSQGDLFVANNSGPNGTISEFAPNGTCLGVYTSSVALDDPADIAFDQFGNLYVACSGNSSIVKIPPPGAGSATVFAATGLSNPQGLAFGPNGNLYVSDQNTNSVEEITPAGQVSTFYKDGSYTILDQVEGLAFDSAGNLYVASNQLNTVEKISPGGTPSLFAGNGDPSNPTDPTGIYNPIGVAFDSSGDLYVANFHHTQVEGEPYEGHGISYTDEFSSTGAPINNFTNNPDISGEDPNLRDGNYFAFETDAGVPLLDPIPEPSTSALVALGAASFAWLAWTKRVAPEALRAMRAPARR